MRLLRLVVSVAAAVLIIGLSVTLGAALAPGLPWWAWVFAVVFWVLFWNRRRLRAAGLLEEAPDGPLWSPTRTRGSDR